MYAKDTDMEVGTLRTFHKNDEEETEVEKEDMVEGTRSNMISVNWEYDPYSWSFFFSRKMTEILE